MRFVSCHLLVQPQVLEKQRILLEIDSARPLAHRAGGGRCLLGGGEGLEKLPTLDVNDAARYHVCNLHAYALCDLHHGPSEIVVNHLILRVVDTRHLEDPRGVLSRHAPSHPFFSREELEPVDQCEKVGAGHRVVALGPPPEGCHLFASSHVLFFCSESVKQQHHRPLYDVCFLVGRLALRVTHALAPNLLKVKLHRCDVLPGTELHTLEIPCHHVLDVDFHHEAAHVAVAQQIEERLRLPEQAHDVWQLAHPPPLGDVVCEEVEHLVEVTDLLPLVPEGPVGQVVFAEGVLEGGALKVIDSKKVDQKLIKNGIPVIPQFVIRTPEHKKELPLSHTARADGDEQQNLDQYRDYGLKLPHNDDKKILCIATPEEELHQFFSLLGRHLLSVPKHSKPNQQNPKVHKVVD
mmetsp:Transcript_43981/g.107267  ORF Transcript_43981/g.107267 Transcript_43981/m.107267 type:complete len:407 (+) Transcript_43981:1309-2529(+)